MIVVPEIPVTLAFATMFLPKTMSPIAMFVASATVIVLPLASKLPVVCALDKKVTLSPAVVAVAPASVTVASLLIVTTDVS